MTANKHTPGKWSVGATDPDTAEIEIVSEGRPYICLVLPGAVDDRTEANARLIASAPELLEALANKVRDAEQRMFEDWLEFNSPSGDHETVQRQWLESNDYRGLIGEWREQLDAIAKATGGAE